MANLFYNPNSQNLSEILDNQQNNKFENGCEMFCWRYLFECGRALRLHFVHIWYRQNRTITIRKIAGRLARFIRFFCFTQLHICEQQFLQQLLYCIMQSKVLTRIVSHHERCEQNTVHQQIINKPFKKKTGSVFHYLLTVPQVMTQTTHLTQFTIPHIYVPGNTRQRQ